MVSGCRVPGVLGRHDTKWENKDSSFYVTLFLEDLWFSSYTQANESFQINFCVWCEVGIQDCWCSMQLSNCSQHRPLKKTFPSSLARLSRINCPCRCGFISGLFSVLLVSSSFFLPVSYHLHSCCLGVRLQIRQRKSSDSGETVAHVPLMSH